MYLIGIVYLIFGLREPNKRKKKDVDGVDNPAFEKVNIGGQSLEFDETQHQAKSCLLDFFNPIVAVECIRLILKKRPFNARSILILLLFLYLVVLSTAGKTNTKANVRKGQVDKIN